MNVKEISWSISLAVGVSFIAFQNSPAIAAGLKDTVEAAIRFHPDIKALKANRNAIEEELKAARGLALPSVRVESRYGLHADRNTRQRYGDASIKLRQPLYDGGKYRAETNRQLNRVSSAENRVKDTLDTVALQAIQAYLELERARRIVLKSKRNLTVVQRIHRRVASSVRGGRSTGAELEQANARLHSARNAVATAEIQAMDAASLFITAIGREPGRLEGVKLPKRILPGSLAEVLSLARHASPKLIAIRHDALAAEAAIETARSVLRPKFDLELSASHRDEIRDTSDRNQTLKAMVVFSMSLYNGGIDRSRVEEAQHRALEAKHLAGSATVSIEREIRLSWNRYVTMRKRVQILSAQADSNRRLTQTRLRQFQSGLSSLISILDAQQESYIADVQATNDYNSGRFAFFKILALSGKLDDAFNY